MTFLESSLKITHDHMDIIRVWRASGFADKWATEEELFDLYSKFYSWLKSTKRSDFAKLLQDLSQVELVATKQTDVETLTEKPGARFLLKWEKIYDLILKGAIQV